MKTDLTREPGTPRLITTDILLPILIPILIVGTLWCISQIPLPIWRVQFKEPICRALTQRGIWVHSLGKEPESGCQASLPFKITGSTARIQVDRNGRPIRMNIPLQGIVLAEKE
ncbi:MAG: hypothetical protein KGI54_10775 [Pseudomonadota bacterium]|nr:hypothetical protein [Pseudomonadota bacterium]